MTRGIRAMFSILLVLALVAACSAQKPQPIPLITVNANLPALEVEAFPGYRSLAELLDIFDDSALALYSEDGAITQGSGATLVEVRKGRVYAKGGQHPLIGIVKSPPAQGNTVAFSWALAQVESGNQALVIVIDGLGFEVFTQALAQGLIPNLAKGEAVGALTVYRPVTNAGMAAILTGQGPDKNGIHDRSNRQPQVPDILGLLSDMGKKGVVIEGEINILDLKGEVILNIDTNGDGCSDDEILEAALIRVDMGYDYMLVHFHSLDDAGHSFGPWAVQSLDRLVVMDQYVAALLDVWPGPVLVVSDHGAHSNDQGGDHGEFRYEDMFVPVIIFSREVE